MDRLSQALDKYKYINFGQDCAVFGPNYNKTWTILWCHYCPCLIIIFPLDNMAKKCSLLYQALSIQSQGLFKVGLPINLSI